MQYEKHDAGHVLCREGDPAECLYVIVSGSCAVTIRRDPASIAAGMSAERRVTLLGRMSVFGENALVETANGGARTRTATVTVESESVQLLTLTQVAFDELAASGLR